MTEKESNPLVDYLRTSGMNFAARALGLGIPGYYLAENLQGPGIQWASGALTVAAIVVSGKFQTWRASGASHNESWQRIDVRWSKQQREKQLGEVSPLPHSSPSPGPAPSSSPTNLPDPPKPPAKPRGPRDETSPPHESKRTTQRAHDRGQKPGRGRKPSTEAPPRRADEPPPPGEPRGRRQK